MSVALGLLFDLEMGRADSPVDEDLEAIITHWLHDTDAPPLLLGLKAAQPWREALRAYMNVSESKPIRIDTSNTPFPLKPKSWFNFIDLFAGIGGFRLALQGVGGRSVFASEWETKAKQTYYANYGETPFGDIRRFTNEAASDKDIQRWLPNHDVLAGGFPCQPFSGAGVSARNSLGQSHGFSCEIQGTLFFDMMRIARVKRPAVLFLENVKNLFSHDKGRTFDRIRRTIEEDLKYSFHYAVIDSSPLVPQRRRRCYMVAFRDGRDFAFPEISGPPLPLRGALEDSVDPRFTLSDRMWSGHIARTNRNLERGTGFTAFAADLDKPSHTLVARYYKDGKECLIPQAGQNPRLLTPRECARLQGYPENFLPHPTVSHAYRQFGNSVAVPVVERIAASIAPHLKEIISR